MGEVIGLPDTGGELAQDATEKIAAEQVKGKFAVQRVFVLGKIFPQLLKTEDFGKIVNELAYDRNPGAFMNHEEQPLLERITAANNNNAPVADAA